MVIGRRATELYIWGQDGKGSDNPGNSMESWSWVLLAMEQGRDAQLLHEPSFCTAGAYASHSLGIQVPSQKVLGPSKPTYSI